MLTHLSCKEATRLLSKQRDSRLTWRESWSLHLHLIVCQSCSRCQKQFRLLGQYRRRFKDAPPENPESDADDVPDKS